MRPYVLLVASIAALGGLLFGYDTGVISGAILFISKQFVLDNRLQAFTISVVLIGCIGGSAVSGLMADRIGRRPTLFGAGVIFLLGALLSALAGNEAILLCGRFVVGLGIGLSSVVAPLYISEVAPAPVRGALVSLYQFAITIGILAAYIVDYLLAGGGQWRWMLGLAVIPSLILMGGMIRMPESPRYLFKVGRDPLAREELQRIYDDESTSKREEASIMESLKVKRGGLRALLSPAIRPALFLGVSLAILQQITGINSVIYYGPRIFEMAGVASAAASILAQSLVGAVNCGMTLVAIFFVDRIGRKPLLYAGLSGMFVALTVMAYSFSQPRLSGSLGTIALVSMMVYVGCFAFSFGPILWLLLSEIFPLPVRGTGMSVSTLANWVGNFAVSQSFLSMVERLGSPATFGVYAALCIVTIIFVRTMVPETKQELLEQVRVGAA